MVSSCQAVREVLCMSNSLLWQMTEPMEGRWGARVYAVWCCVAGVLSFVYTRNGTFGHGIVALNNNGSLLAVSARLEDSMAIGINNDAQDNTAINSGAVYLLYNLKHQR